MDNRDGWGERVREIRAVSVTWWGYSWRNKDNLVYDFLLWNPTHRRASVGRPAVSYLPQFCVDTGCHLEDLLWAMDDRVGWKESGKSVLSAWLDDDDDGDDIKMNYKI